MTVAFQKKTGVVRGTTMQKDKPAIVQGIKGGSNNNTMNKKSTVFAAAFDQKNLTRFRMRE